MENSAESESSLHREYIERVKKFLKPLETRWDYVQSVLLWEKPTHSLCYFIAMTALFGAMSSGRFRLVLLLVVIMASSLLLDDFRTKAWQLLQQGGFGAASEPDSRNTSLSFSRLCERLATIWSCFAAWYEKLNKLKTDSSYKYYGVLFGVLLVFVFAYQYLPLMKICYLTACALYFWPAIKHYGIHKKVKTTVGPFYMPFLVQWQHNRTKRQRDTVKKVAEGPADSDEEFAEELHPTADDAAVNQDVTLQEEQFSASEPSSPDPPLEVRVLEGIISSAVTQGLSSMTSRQDQDDDDADDGRQTGITPPETPDVDTENPSFDSSAVFLDSLQFSSISQGGDTLEFEEGQFMEGLEFPDIEKDSDSDSEPIHPVGKSNVDNKPKQVSAEETQVKELKDKVSRQTSGTTESVMTSSGNTDVSDYEVLDQSEAEGMTPTDETDSVDSSGGLGSVTNYVGKWLGY